MDMMEQHIEQEIEDDLGPLQPFCEMEPDPGVCKSEVRIQTAKIILVYRVRKMQKNCGYQIVHF